MKKLILSFAAGLIIVTSAAAQSQSSLTDNELKTVDLSGKYVGKRNQYNPDHKTIMQTFEYEFNLVQTGSTITGTSTIIKSSGDFADMKVRGLIVGDKFYFEEYEILNQIKDPNMVWCYKSGALNITKDAGSLKLSGATDSYMADYYIPCTGGITDMTKVDNSNNFKIEDAANPANAANPLTGAANNMNVYPNPFVDATSISYTLGSNSSVTLEVYDLTGRRVAILENNTAKNTGTYNVPFSAKNAGLAAGVLIAKLTVDGKVYSSEMVGMK